MLVHSLKTLFCLCFVLVLFLITLRRKILTNCLKLSFHGFSYSELLESKNENTFGSGCINGISYSNSSAYSLRLKTKTHKFKYKVEIVEI